MLPIPLIEVGNLPKKPIDFAVGHSDFEAGISRDEAADRASDGERSRSSAAMPATPRTRATARTAIAAPCRRPDCRSSRAAGWRSSTRSMLACTASTVSELSREFDGLVIGGEIWTAAIVLKLLGVGRRIPDDVAVVGIGEVELAHYLPVPLTYVALPRARGGNQIRRARDRALAGRRDRSDGGEAACSTDR